MQGTMTNIWVCWRGPQGQTCPEFQLGVESTWRQTKVDWRHQGITHQGVGVGNDGSMCTEFPFGAMNHFCNWTKVMIAQDCERIKCRWAIHCKKVNLCYASLISMKIHTHHREVGSWLLNLNVLQDRILNQKSKIQDNIKRGGRLCRWMDLCMCLWLRKIWFCLWSKELLALWWS